MKATIIYLLFISLAISVSAQEKILFNDGKQPYFMVDNFTADFKYLVLSPAKIESVSVLKDSNAIAVYGDKAKYGAVIIKTKPNTTLLQIGEILSKYNVSKTDQNLRICINKTLVSRPELILIEDKEIFEVEITTDRFWIHPEEANSNERFINIKINNTSKKAYNFN